MFYNAGDSQHTQNIQINKVAGENEKCVFCFMGKTKQTFLANPIHMKRKESDPSKYSQCSKEIIKFFFLYYLVFSKSSMTNIFSSNVN